MRGQRRRLPVQPLVYVMSTKVIFRRAEAFRDVRMQANFGPMFERKYIYISLSRAPSFSLFTKNLRARQDCMRTSQKTDFRSSKNNFRGHNISRPTPWASLSVPSFSLALIKQKHRTENIINANKCELSKVQILLACFMLNKYWCKSK